MRRSIFVLLAIITAMPAFAADLPQPEQVRRLAEDPDRAGEALAAGLRAVADAPEDPSAFAALVDAVQAARGPTLDARDVQAARLGAGAARVEVTLADGTRRVFDAATGAGTGGELPPDPPAAPAHRGVEAVDGGCRADRGLHRTSAFLAPCADLAGGVVSPDGRRAVTLHATSRRAYTERLWDLDAGTVLATLRTDVNPAGRWQAWFSADSQRLFTYDNGGMRAQPLYDARTGKVVAVLGPVQREGRFTPDGTRVVLADVDLESFDADDGVLVSRLGVDGDAWSPRAFLDDGRHVAVADGEHTLLWDVVDGDVVRVLGTWDDRGSDGRRVLAGRPGGPVRVFDTGPAEAEAVLGAPGASVRALAVALDGTRVAVADGNHVRAWNLDGWVLLDVQAPHVRWLALAGDRLVASTGDAWDLRSGVVAGAHLFRYLERVLVAPGGRVAYAWDKTGQVPSRFRDPFRPETVARLPRDTQIVAEPRGCFSADGTRFAGSLAGVGVWSVSTGRRLLQAGGDAPYAHVVLSADGVRVAAQAEHRAEVAVYEVDTGTRVGAVRPEAVPVRLALSADGARLATGDAAGRVRLWAVDDHGAGTTVAGHAGAVDALAFSPDGARLLSAGGGVVRLWDVSTGLGLAAWPSAADAFAGFTDDGRAVVLVGPDGQVQIEPATAAGYRAIACRWLAHDPAGAPVRGLCGSTSR